MFLKIGVGPPNHPILIGFSIINHPFWVPLFLETSTWLSEFIVHTGSKLQPTMLLSYLVYLEERVRFNGSSGTADRRVPRTTRKDHASMKGLEPSECLLFHGLHLNRNQKFGHTDTIQLGLHRFFCRRKRRIRPGILDAYPWLSWKGRGSCFPIHKHNKYINNMIKSIETYRNQILGRLNIGHYPRESFMKVGQSKPWPGEKKRKGAVSLNPYDKVCFRGS